ncbi:hypothetical protein GCM10007989_14280 [Devosia pacifica]|uniref:Uncharacterized protein n=1 Tax=Devosia pacifica TaxID=1335967 RepID=A0A918S2D1_9HYPH|nr:hypothetical protein GCM10007989_14280 [Devosia pacifica]
MIVPAGRVSGARIVVPFGTTSQSAHAGTADRDIKPNPNNNDTARLKYIPIMRINKVSIVQ